jgi:hypothetical protein
MSKQKQTHVFRSSDRTVKVTIQECKKHIKVDIVMSKYGGADAAWGATFETWFRSLVGRYGNDPRPVVFRHPITGETVVIGGDDVHGGKLARYIGRPPETLPPPESPCPRCGGMNFIVWVRQDDPDEEAISCKRCGQVISSTHPLRPGDGPVRIPS